jgi:hypothetical protein
MITKRSLSLAALVLASVLSREAASSTVSAVSVSLSKAVADSRLIVVASVQQVGSFIPPTAGKDDPGLRYFEVRIEEVLKSSEAAAPKNLKGTAIAVFDPQEMFYHDHAAMIAAGVISFVDARYRTRIQNVAAGDRLVFFLAGRDKQPKLPRPDTYSLVCGRAYDALDIKRAVLKRLK